MLILLNYSVRFFFFSSINFKYLIFFSILKGYLTNQTEDKEDHYEIISDDFTNNDSSDNNKASDNEKSKIKNLNSIKVIFFLIFIKKKRSVYI